MLLSGLFPGAASASSSPVAVSARQPPHEPRDTPQNFKLSLRNKYGVYNFRSVKIEECVRFCAGLRFFFETFSSRSGWQGDRAQIRSIESPILLFASLLSGRAARS